MCTPIVTLCYCDAVTVFPYGDGQIGFVGKDVAEVLGYANYRNAIAKHVDEEEKLRTQIEYAGQKREAILINESGLYSLVLSSKLPQAREFKHWVTSEVLRQIRKDGRV